MNTRNVISNYHSLLVKILVKLIIACNIRVRLEILKARSYDYKDKHDCVRMFVVVFLFCFFVFFFFGEFEKFVIMEALNRYVWYKLFWGTQNNFRAPRKK